MEFRPSVERCLIKTNPGRVSQILIHLLQNAAKFTDKGSIVLDYELNRNEREIIYRITDTGKGIPADKQEYVLNVSPSWMTLLREQGWGFLSAG